MHSVQMEQKHRLGGKCCCSGMTRIHGSVLGYTSYHSIIVVACNFFWLTQIKENTLTESSGHQSGDLEKLVAEISLAVIGPPGIGFQG